MAEARDTALYCAVKMLLNGRSFVRFDLGPGPAMHEGGLTVGLHAGFSKTEFVIEAGEGNGHLTLVFSPEDWGQAKQLATCLLAYSDWAEKLPEDDPSE